MNFWRRIARKADLKKLRAENTDLRARLDRAEELLREYLAHTADPAFDDARLRYIEIQVPRVLVDDTRAALDEEEE